MALEVIRRHPAVANGQPPVLFVHGAWHGGWCWDQGFLEYFAARGWDVYAMSLRGSRPQRTGRVAALGQDR